MRFFRITPLLCLFFGTFIWAPEAFALDKFMALGTASTSGVYYPVGKGICKLFNAKRESHLARCSTEITGGSAYNVQAVKTGELDVAMTRTDLAYNSYKGIGMFEDVGADENLRVIMAPYANVLGIIVKKDLGVKSLDGLTGKRISIGNKGSGEHTDSGVLFKAMGWQKKDFEEVLELPGGEAAEAFCKGDLDALVNSLGIPANFYARMTNECGGVFLDIPNATIDAIGKQNLFVQKYRIPAGMYPSNPNGVDTLAVKVVLITSARLNLDAVYSLTKITLDDLPRFKKIHPALGAFNTQKMFNGYSGFPPIHEGAVRYYNEKGLQ